MPDQITELLRRIDIALFDFQNDTGKAAKVIHLTKADEQILKNYLNAPQLESPHKTSRPVFKLLSEITYKGIPI